MVDVREIWPSPHPRRSSAEKFRDKSVANRGLIAERTAARWKHSLKDIKLELDKQATIDAIQGEAGDKAALEAYSKRLEELVDARGGVIAIRESIWRYATGLGIAHPLENGLAWHPTLGTPYAPGSGIKGMVQAYLHEWTDAFADPDKGRAEAVRLFGQWQPESNRAISDQENRRGSLIFLDAVPIEPVRISGDVMGQHNSEYYKGKSMPDDANEVLPHLFLTVERARFQFAIIPVEKPERDGERHPDCVAMMERLDEALKTTGLGAKTKAGYGRFVVPTTPEPTA